MSDYSAEVNIERSLAKAIKKYKEDLVSFERNFSKDPQRALEGSTSVFRAAAAVPIMEACLNLIQSRKIPGDNKMTAAKLQEHCKDFLLQKAHPEFSTSPTSNLIHQWTIAAWAEVLEIIRWA